MSYVKQNFQDNTILYAENLNSMDDQIAKNETDITRIDSEFEIFKQQIEGELTTLNSLIGDGVV